MSAQPTPHVLLVTSAGASAHTVVPVMAAVEAAGMRLRAIDVGHAGGGGSSITDRVRRALLGESAERRLRRELDLSPPDVAVAFDPHAALALSVARDQVTSPAPVVAVVGELSPDPAWAHADADRFVCFDDVVALALVELGVEGDRILVAGAIGERRFVDAAREDRGALRTRFGIKSTPVLLEVAGVGADAVGALAQQLSLLPASRQHTYLFDAGTDVAVAAVLRRQVPSLGLKAKLFGDTGDVPLLWRCAEAVVARPSASTVSRVLHVGARLIVWQADNTGGDIADALEARGRAMIARSTYDVGSSIIAALARPGYATPDPDGAQIIAEVIRAVAGDKHGVVEERLASARADVTEDLREARAATGAAARVVAAPGELEDLGGGDAAPTAAVPDAATMERLRRDTKARIADLHRSLAQSRNALDATGTNLKAANAERARMHSLLAELASLERDLAELERSYKVASAHPDVTGSSSYYDGAAATASRPPPARSVDDALAALKRSAATAGPAPKPAGPKRTTSTAPTTEDALAALKRKMASQTPKK